MAVSFSPAELRIASALATAVLPPGRRLPGADGETVRRLEQFVGSLPPTLAGGYRALLWTLESSTLPRFGGRFSSLPLGRRLRTLELAERSEPTRLALRALLSPIKLAYLDDHALHEALGSRHRIEAPAQAERARWREQVIKGAELPEGEALECDVVVVGTGAGGAPVALSLAERGLAVLMLEEGELHTRGDFNGRPVEMMRKLYRRSGLTFAFGNTAIPIPVGRAVGGTTIINSGTCLRAPETTLAHWREAYGLGELTAEKLGPYYERAERELGVAPSSKEAIGRPGEIIARGCDALGYSHHPLPRNAPGCDGQSLCCFGCPTDAKRSTNVSFVPAALGRGAQLVTGVRVDRVLVEGETAVGVEGEITTSDGPARRLTVRSRAVVLACGSLSTPVLLLQNRIANASGQVGRNLSIHPAASALAIFDEKVDSWRAVPQGYAIDQFVADGILFEGATAPLDLAAASMSGFGPAYVSLLESLDRSLMFGFMVKDTSRGRVTAGGDGEPRISYWMNRNDFSRMQRGFGILARVFLAAGAAEVYPGIVGFERLRSLADVEALERARLSPRQVDITAYHPLGTARMGTDPLQSVVGPTHETHDVHNLFICDGSSLPGSVGANPQMTIMAMALRAAEFIGRRAEKQSARRG